MAKEVNNLHELAANTAKRVNRRQRVPKLPEMLQKLSDATTVHIYNVGPFRLRRELGSIGSFTVNACPPEKDYVDALQIPGVFTEPIQGQDQNTMELRTEEGGGRYIAEQIIGVGAYLSKRDSFEPMGVFIGSEVGPSAKPTKEEITKAKHALQGYLQELVQQARIAFENNRPLEIVEQHRLAARMLRLENEKWYEQRTAKARQDCPSCGTIINMGVKICPSCKWVLDTEWFAKNKSGFAQ